MKSYLILPFILIAAYSSCMSKISSSQQQDNFKVYKIDSINSYYLVYCEKDAQKFKIVARMEAKMQNGNEIKLGGFYNFALNIFPKNEGDNPLTKSALNVNCYMFDKDTKICKEEGINGLYTTANLSGLYYIKSIK